MSDAVHYRLHNPKQAHDVMVKAWDWTKSKLAMGSKRLVLEIRQETRSTRQNRLLHAMLGDIAAQVEWAGAKRDVDTWKRLLVAAWCRARKEPVELLPALDGVGVDIVFKRTSRLSTAECAELCDFIQAWAAEHDVVLRDAVPWVTDPETGEITQ